MTESRVTTTTDGPASDAAEVRARYAVFVDHDGVISPHYSAAELGATRIALEGAQDLSALGVGPGAPAEGGRWSPMWLAVDNEVIGEAHPHGEWLAAPPAG